MTSLAHAVSQPASGRSNFSLAQIAKDFGISESFLRDWLDIGANHGVGTPASTTRRLAFTSRTHGPVSHAALPTDREPVPYKEVFRALSSVDFAGLFTLGTWNDDLNTARDTHTAALHRIKQSITSALAGDALTGATA